MSQRSKDATRRKRTRGATASRDPRSDVQDNQASGEQPAPEPWYGRVPNQPPKKNVVGLIAISLLMVAWCGFLVWLILNR